jgi:hypothetical protein
VESRSTGWHGPLERFTPGRTLRVGKDGTIDVPIDPNSPFYFTERGLQMRTGDGLTLTTGSPVRVVRDVVQASEVRDETSNVADTQRRLLAAIATINATLGAVVSSPIRARGSVVLVAGSATVTTALVSTGDLIFVTNNTAGGVPGFLLAGNIVDGVSFDVTSSNILDTSTIAWMVVSP